MQPITCISMIKGKVLWSVWNLQRSQTSDCCVKLVELLLVDTLVQWTKWLSSQKILKKSKIRHNNPAKVYSLITLIKFLCTARLFQWGFERRYESINVNYNLAILFQNTVDDSLSVLRTTKLCECLVIFQVLRLLKKKKDNAKKWKNFLTENYWKRWLGV